MKSVKVPSRWAYCFSLIAFVIAALSITGVLLKTDLKGRVIWCGLWGMIGVAWLLGIVRSRRGNPANERGKKND